MYWQDFHRNMCQFMAENQKLLEKVFLIYLGLEYLITQYTAGRQGDRSGKLDSILGNIVAVWVSGELLADGFGSANMPA